MIGAGSVWRIDLGGARGHEQQGFRPFIVIQDDALAPLSVVIGVPTSIGAKDSRLHVPVEVAGEETLALCEQIRAVDRDRLRRPMGSISYGELQDIRRVVAQLIGMRWPTRS